MTSPERRMSIKEGEDVCERGKVGRNSVVRFLLAC